MKTAVMTDTNSGIMKAEADSMGIFLIPMPVIINDETHYEGIDLTETSFYESGYPVYDEKRAGKPANHQFFEKAENSEGQRNFRAGGQPRVKAVRADEADDETNEKQ